MIIEGMHPHATNDHRGHAMTCDCAHDSFCECLCLGFVKQFKQIDRVIIGIDNSDHLKQLVNDFSLNIDVNPQYLSVEDTRLIDPFNWKI